jgi:hypothetical protein
MPTSDRIAAGRLRGLIWGIVVAALVADPSYAHGFNLSRRVSPTSAPTCARPATKIFTKPFLKSPHYQADTKKTRQVERPGLRTLPRSRLQACRDAVADRHCEPVEGLAKAHRRVLSEMPLQSVHTNWADPRLGRERLSPVYGVLFGCTRDSTISARGRTRK